ncbi:unnamed protein product [Rotaria sp. Silwood1]|nr:unnamed protein product [Rotaria sp. Silwood1]CAF1269904.1 unnamed protein product [Rotaria sp. Silwood1]CAF3531451.1 unnamed protein product [Rotaria sp. Silwood1]CAF4599306.1 unnamed protein product [Rotaria sp. Silwood1]CAF4724290.1 unnamed protein product [Rotaria sp. Silwood1]
MYRVLTSSNRAVAQRLIRSTLTFARAESTTDPEAGSVASGQDAFSTKEKAEETRWARRFEAEQAAKRRAQLDKSGQSGGQSKGDSQSFGQQQSGSTSSGGSLQQRLAALEAEKQRIEEEIAELKRQ